MIVFTDPSEANSFVVDNMVEGKADATKDNGKLFDRTEFKGKKLVTRELKPFAAPN